MRFADIFGKGLVGALTGIDLTDMVMKGGLVGAATGVNPTDLIASGGLLGAATGMKTPGLSSDGRFRDFLNRDPGKMELEKMPYYPGQDNGGYMQMPYYPEGKDLPFNERPLQPYDKYYDHGRTPGITDFDGNYNPTFGNFTPAEIRRMNEMYPIGNIGKQMHPIQASFWLGETHVQ